MIPAIWLALSSVIYSWIKLFFSLNHICSKSDHSSSKSHHFCSKSHHFCFENKKLVLTEFRYFKMVVMKWYLNLVSCNFHLKSCFWFQLIFYKLASPLPDQHNIGTQNGSNKVVIEIHAAKFWSELILVISNRSRTARMYNFKVMRMISD